VRRKRETEQELRDLRAELGGMRERLSRLDAAEEQAQIAFELYDGIARALHEIAVDATNAEQPAIRRTADAALGELDRLRHLLRAADDDVTERSLAQVALLVERAREGGMPVTLHVEGAPRRIPTRSSTSSCRRVAAARIAPGTSSRRRSPRIPARPAALRSSSASSAAAQLS
jgi:signal transduction histidine kinase